MQTTHIEMRITQIQERLAVLEMRLKEISEQLGEALLALRQFSQGGTL